MKVCEKYFRVGNSVYSKGQAIIFSEAGNSISVSGKGELMFMSGRPLKEPVAWYGSIVMNNYDQIKHNYTKKITQQ